MFSRSQRTRRAGTLLCAGLLSSGRLDAIEPVPHHDVAALDVPSAGAALEWARDVYERSVDSVVIVDAGGKTGTGFCMFAPDLILTALHVVDDAPLIRVESTRGHRRAASVVTYSEADDLALLRLDRAFDTMAPLQPETAASVGEGVVVIGHPLAQLARREPKLRGLLAWSLSNGVVGAVSSAWLQTNAALNPGTSGGPVLNHQGRVLGVVSARVRDAQNIGMISRIQRAEELLGQLDRGAPPRRIVKLDKLELGLVIQWGEDTLSGIAAGAGLRVLDDLVLRARAGFLDGAAEPQAATVLTSHVTRVFLEAVGGYALSLPGQVTLAAEAGLALARELREDASLRAQSDPSCAMPPCLVAGDVIRDSAVSWPLWPTLGVAADWGLLRLSYALQVGDPVQHRVMATFAF
jgi:S1-C subfamily serine protease